MSAVDISVLLNNNKCLVKVLSILLISLYRLQHIMDLNHFASWYNKHII